MVKKGGKKIAQAPLSVKKDAQKKDSLFEKKPRNFRTGGDIQPKRDLTRFVKWPLYVRLQRRKRIMLQRLKVPPALAQFEHTVDKNKMLTILRFMKKLQPENRAQKKERLQEMQKQKQEGKQLDTKKPICLKYGINHVTKLVEEQKQKLVLIAHDVDPIELICWLPALCRKKNVPYQIVKGKSRLGQLVHKKTQTCLQVTSVEKGQAQELQQLTESFMQEYNENTQVNRKWGGGIKGVKSQHILDKRQAQLQLEQQKKTGLVK